MADIFEEVEEGLRQDRAERLWKKYGIFAYIAAALLIGGVALYEFIDHRQSQSVEASAEQFETARDTLDDQDFQQAATAFETLSDSDARIAPVAANYLAEARLKGNADRTAAVAALEKAANTETPIGKLSLLKAAYLKSETMSRSELETYLGGLADEESQFGALALELVAAKAAEEEDYAYAREAFNDLRFLANVPQGVQQRARIALDTLPAAEPSEAADSDTASQAGGEDAETGTPAEAPDASQTDGDPT
ncbi:hypothetical protein [Henriciella aquimarina]|uniref:hypothetical protein n=1 Tax=Henriciella aquimarina TaxID=545261 RepID=UPI000A0574DF|nr:hypothetical protein [Henriciella aquimarina]